ncbi:MAG: zf-HC2 domain-containing protein [Pyrinomonadaceae bacterium]
MTCEQCQEFISAFLDNELGSTDSLNVQTHLTVCAECARVCEDFASILEFCGETPTGEILPPNPQALWCRISNIIESEVEAEIKKDKAENEPAPGKKGLFGGSRQLSFSQMFSAVLGIALISSLLTIVGIQNYSSPPSDDLAASPAERSIFQKLLGKIGLVETPQQMRERRINERLSAIDYWNKRVQTRRAQWDAQMRDAFDRNLREIDKTVFEYNNILETNPQDELSGEMLDSTLNEKMELLREFAEL